MMSVTSRALLGIGALCLIATICIYLLIVPFALAFFGPSLAGITIGICMLFAGLLLAAQRPRHSAPLLFQAGVTSLASICALALCTTSIIFLAAPFDMLGTFLAIALLIALAFASGLIVLHVASKKAAEQDLHECTLNTAMTARADELDALAQRSTSEEVRAKLQRAADQMRFSDGGSITPTDHQIDHAISKISSVLDRRDAKHMDVALEELERAMKERADQIRQLRRGGI